jgi:hypothetical protein
MFDVKNLARLSLTLFAMVCAGAAHGEPEPGRSQEASPTSRNGPIWDGRQHQPSLEEVFDRERAKGQHPGISGESNPSEEELYRHVLKQSGQPFPPSLEPPQ